MESNWLQFCGTEEQRQRFDDEGYLVVEDALSPEMVEKLTVAVDRVDAKERIENELAPGAEEGLTPLARKLFGFDPWVD